METQDNDRVRSQVRTAYAKVAKGADGCSVGCCGTQGGGKPGAGLHAGGSGEPCPRARTWASAAATRRRSPRFAAGETVLDLGSGAGFDCFLAAKRVGRSGPRHRRRHDARDGREGARQRAPRRGARNVEFRLGEIEHLPVAGRVRRRHSLELRDQPLARQGGRVPRGVPRAQARRPARDLRRRGDGGDAGERWRRASRR